jgi:uncharacterized coiled-coil protein SlyX
VQVLQLKKEIAMSEAIPKPTDLEPRIQEIEIKMAFLEKELEEYKEVAQGMHVRLSATEDRIQKMTRAISDPQDTQLPD